MAQNKFETGLCCNCFESCGYCCLGFCLPCVGSGLVMEKFNGESWAPHAAFYLLWSCIGCPCIMAMDRRSKIRKQFNIEGGACTDCLATCCCEPCAQVQERIQLEKSGSSPVRQQPGKVSDMSH